MVRSECLLGQRLQVLPCFWKLQLSGLHHRKVLCQWTWVSFGDFHVHCALCSEVCGKCNSSANISLEAEQYCQNCQKYFHHHHHIIVRMVLIAVATRCHLHGNNLDYPTQARGAANSNGSETRRLRAAGSLQVLHPCWPLRRWPDQHKYRNGTCVVISINIFLPWKTNTETTPERSLKISISILSHYWRVIPSLI